MPELTYPFYSSNQIFLPCGELFILAIPPFLFILIGPPLQPFFNEVVITSYISLLPTKKFAADAAELSTFGICCQRIVGPWFSIPVRVDLVGCKFIGRVPRYAD